MQFQGIHIKSILAGGEVWVIPGTGGKEGGLLQELTQRNSCEATFHGFFRNGRRFSMARLHFSCAPQATEVEKEQAAVPCRGNVRDDLQSLPPLSLNNPHITMW
jgi:hypothetical protein